MRRILSVALLALLACGGKQTSTPTGPVGPAQPGDGQPPVTAPPATGEDAPLPLWPEVKSGKLPNGLTYYILKHGKPEKRALLWLAVNAGSILEDDDQRGLAHFDEHMAFNGSKRFPKQDLVNYLQSIGMRFGADVNAYTNFDETVYQLEVPSDDPKYLDKGFDILRDWAGDVTYDPTEVDKERGVVLEEWRLGRGAQARLFDKQAKVIFAGSRYAERLTIGLPDVLKKAPRDALVRFYKDWYRPDLMAVIAVGDFNDPAAIQRQIEAKFGDLKNPAKERPRVHAEVPKADGTRISIETDRELPVSAVSVFNILTHRSESSVKDLRRIVVEQVYQSIMNERLGSLARKKDAPFQFSVTAVQPLTREVDAFTRTAVAKTGRVEDSLKALFLEVLRVEKFGFTQSELERARTNIARFYEQAATAQDSSDSGDYTSEITRNFFEGELMIGRTAEKDYAMKFLPTITLAELNGLAKSYGGAENRVIVMAGPDGAPLPTKERVSKLIEEVAGSAIEAWEDKVAAAALMATPPKAGTVTKESKIEKINVTEWTLSNGVRVIVKPTDYEVDTLQIAGSSPGGLALASAKDFPNARFADEIAEIGGVGEFDVEALAKVLAGKQLRVSADIGETTESVDAEGSARDMETMLQLVYLKMTAPRKDAQAFGVWKSNTAEQLQNRLRVPEVQFSLQSSDALWKGNARRKPPQPADIEKVDADKALAFYKDRFGDASDFTFVIVGNIDLAKLKPLVEIYLASLPAKGRKEKEKDLGIRRAGGVVKKTFAVGTEPKARVQLTFHGDEAWTRDKDRDMYILGQVLSRRLRETLREDLGGVYGVGAGGAIARAPHQERTFTIGYGCDPARVDELVKATQDEIAKIAKEGVKPEILEDAKKTFERERELQLRNNDFWTGWLQSSYRFGDDPTIVLDPSGMLNRMTSDNVKAAAKRYLDGKQSFLAIMTPSTGEPPKKNDPATPKKGPPPGKTVPGAEQAPGDKQVPGAEKPPAPKK
jgi:zinc protease